MSTVMERQLRGGQLALSLLCLAALLVCLPVTEAAALERHVKLIQILHRHGARSSEPSYNQSMICTESPCGYLSASGLTMLQNVGRYMRDRYNKDASVVDAPMFPSRDYDLDVVYSRSTDVLRTLQSAEAFLYGFFPNTAALFPAIHTQPKAYDWLLSTTNAMPYLHFYYRDNKPFMRAVVNVPTDKMFPDWTELTRIGAEMYSEDLCNDYVTRSDCAQQLYDIAAAKRAVGELAHYPLADMAYTRLQYVSRAAFDYEFHYDKTDDLHLKQGGRGRVFVSQLLDNIEETIAGGNPFKMMHYSAHDTTLAPVWATLGDRSDNGMLPPFAQTLVAELLQDGAGAYHVRVLRGHPGQDPESGFGFAWDATWRMRCVDASGALYVAADNTCPLADFRRLVAWSAPTSPSGLCYLDEEFMRVRACPEDVGATAATATAAAAAAAGEGALSETCRYYRERCPDYSCPETGCVLNAVTLQCVCHGGSNATETDKPSNTVSGGAAAGIAIGTFLMGCVVAAALTVLVYIWRGTKDYTVIEAEHETH